MVTQASAGAKGEKFFCSHESVLGSYIQRSFKYPDRFAPKPKYPLPDNENERASALPSLGKSVSCFQEPIDLTSSSSFEQVNKLNTMTSTKSFKINSRFI